MHVIYGQARHRRSGGLPSRRPGRRRAQQHPVAGQQAAVAAQRGGNRDVGLGRHGDHAGRVTAGGHDARLSGQGQPVPRNASPAP